MNKKINSTECIYFSVAESLETDETLLKYYEKLIIDDTQELCTAFQYYMKTNFKTIGIFIFHLKTDRKANSSDFIVSAFMTRKSEDIFNVLFIYPSICKYFDIKSIQMLKNELTESIKNQISNAKILFNDESFVLKSNSSYLANILYRIDSCLIIDIKKQISEFDKMIIDVAFKNMNNGELLEIALSSLQCVLNECKNFVLSNENLNKLVEVLFSLNYNSSDREKAINYLAILKLQGQMFPESFYDQFNSYMNGFRKEFQQDFEKMQQSIERNENANGCINLFLNEKSKIILNIAKLNSDIILIDDLTLIVNSFIDRREQFEPYLYIEDIIQLFSQLFTPQKSSKSIDKNLVDKLFKISKNSNNPQVAKAFIIILSNITFEKNGLSIEQVEKYSSKMLPNISIECIDLKLLEILKIKTEDLIAVQEILKKLENDEFDQDEEAFHKVVQIEMKLIKENYEILEDCVDVVKNGKLLTFNCFRVLSEKYISEQSTSDIIKTIIEKDLQTIPKIFIENLKESLKELKQDKKKIEVQLKLCVSLLVGSYFSLEELLKETKIGELIKKSYEFIDDFLEMVIIEVSNSRNISNEIVSVLRAQAERNHIAVNLLNFIEEKESIFEKLRNPREEIDSRKQMLDELMQQSENRKLTSLKTCMDLIKGESALRIKAFETLTLLLPNNYSENKSIYDLIDFEEISNSIFDIHQKCIELISMLHQKDTKADLSAFAKIMFDQIVRGENRENAFKLLNELGNQRHGYKLVKDNLSSLLTILCKCESSLHRRDIITLIETHKIEENEISKFIEIDLWNDLKNSTKSSFMNKSNFIKNGYLLTEQDCEHLVDSLGKRETNIDELKNNFYVLLTVLKKQDLSSAQEAQLFKILKERKDLLKLTSVVGIICYFLMRDKPIDEETLNSIWNFFLQTPDNNEEFLSYTLFIARTCLVKQKAQVPLEVICKAQELLSSEKIPIGVRINCAVIVKLSIEQDPFDKSCLDVLKKVAVQSASEIDDQNLTLNLITFKALRKFIESEPFLALNIFINKFYDKFKERLKEKYSFSFEKLDYFIKKTNQNEKDKYYLLFLLNGYYYQSRNVDFEIFNKLNPSSWFKELLCNSLITQILEENEDAKFYIDDFVLLEFKEQIDLIEIKIKDSLYSFYQFMENLTEIQWRFQYNLSEINIILGILIKESENFKFLTENLLEFDDKIRQYVIESGLKSANISYSSDDFVNLYRYLPYKLQFVSLITSNIPKNSSVEQLNQFASNLLSYKITLKAKFIQTYLTKDKDLKEWSKSLDYFLIGEIIVAKFPEYKFYTKNSSEPKSDLKSFSLLHTKLMRLQSTGWSIESIQKLIKVANNSNLSNLLSSMDPIFEFHLKEYESDLRDRTIIDIYQKSSSEKWSIEINDLAMYRTFNTSFDKNLNQLIKEITNLNDSKAYISILNEQNLLEEFKNVQKTCESTSNVLKCGKDISQWTEDEIEKWAEIVKEKKNDSKVSLYEKVAVVKRGAEIVNGYPPRDIQLLALLILLRTEKNKGRLAQINTGEGKTLTIALLAAIKVLEGHVVDIVTSSTELAKPQSIQQKKFFNLFQISVAHNCHDEIHDIKERYKADVVYGSAGNFQGDILRDEYSKQGTRSERKCDVAIVDEVDSMLIDDTNNIVMLSSPMPGMEFLEPLLAAIWIQLEVVNNHICEIDDKSYFIESDNAFDSGGGLKKNVVENLIEIKGTKNEFVRHCIESHLRKLMRDEDYLKRNKENSKYPEIKVPKHLRELVLNGQLKQWIDSAISAKYTYKLNQNYIIKDAKVYPVDSSNTGVVQRNTHWNDALHQFLQLKHGAKLTPESLTTNFISNVTYFRRYGSNIYGLTGTLGSESVQELLGKTYNVDTVIIPTFRKKQHKELKPIILRDQEAWFNAIVDTSINKLKNRRGVLIITRYISEVEEINRLLVKKHRYDKSKIKLYKTDADSKMIEDEIKPGEVIIATNIAGRGTDIKADKIELNGGLHVIVTFLPKNKRVEEQNVGRTSRTGNKGTSQFIILNEKRREAKEKIEDFCEEHEIEELRKVRDEKEKRNLINAEKEIEQVTLKDKIFVEFCKLLDEFEEDDQITKILRRAVEERFGIWMKMRENEGKLRQGQSEALSLFEDFKDKILDDKKNNNLIKNPWFFVLCGNMYLEVEDEGTRDKIQVSKNDADKDDENKKKHEKAIEYFTKAIELDDYYLPNAYYYRGYARLKRYGKEKYLGLIKMNDEEDNQVSESIKDFENAKRIIEDNMEPLANLIVKASYSEAVMEQAMYKLVLYSVQKNSIDTALGVGDEEYKKRLNMLEKTIELEIERQNANGEKERKRKALEDYVKILKLMKTGSFDPMKNLPINKRIFFEACQLEYIYMNIGYVRIIDASTKSDIEENILFELDIYNTGNKVQNKIENYIMNKLNAYGIENDDPLIKTVLKLDYYDQIAVLKFTFDEENKAKARIEMIEKCIKSLEKSKESIVNGIINDARKNKHGIEIKLENIGKSLPEDQDALLYKSEIDEWKNAGLIGFFQISNKKPIDWWSVIGLTLLGLAQITIGAAIMIYSGGAAASFGVGLIFEGVSDLVAAVKSGIIDRDFSWKEYAIEKLISLSIIIVCAGLSELHHAAKVLSGAKQVIARQVITQTVKEGWMLAAKKVGMNIFKRATTEVANHVVSKIVMQYIDTEVKKRVKNPVEKSLKENDQVHNILKIDGYNRNSYYQSKIKSKASEIMNPAKGQHHKLIHISISISSGIAKQKINGLAQLLQIKEVFGALMELENYIPEFCKALNSAIDKVYNSEAVKSLEKIEKRKHEDEKIEQSHKPAAKNESIEDCIGQRRREEQVELEKDAKSPDDLITKLAEMISFSMCAIIKAKIVNPALSQAVNMAATSVLSPLESQIDNDIEDYHAERRIDFSQNHDMDRLTDEFKKGHQDPKCIDKANKIIKDLRNGGEAGLPHLGALSDEIDRPIYIRDKNGKLLRIIGENKKGEPVEIEYHKSLENNGIGHWTLPGCKNTRFDNLNNNNCLFNVVAEQCGINKPDELRMRTANRMKANEDLLANQVYDIQRLEIYKQNVLVYGGFIDYKGNADEILKKSQGTAAHGQKAPAHPYGHAPNPDGPPDEATPGGIDCVENYSFDSKKSAANSREELADMLNMALESKEGVEAIKRLNDNALLLMNTEKPSERLIRDATRQIIEFTPKERIFQLLQYEKGKVVDQNVAKKVVVVIGHHQNEIYKDNCDPHVQTVYPKMS